MTKLAELASLIRSKNAGPFELTIDIMFDDVEVYERVKRSHAISRNVIAAMYNVKPDVVRFFESDSALAIKVSIPRPIFQGDVGDTDGHGGQQYGPLMDIEVV
jgi:hypothetical protein